MNSCGSCCCRRCCFITLIRVLTPQRHTFWLCVFGWLLSASCNGSRYGKYTHKYFLLLAGWLAGWMGVSLNSIFAFHETKLGKRVNNYYSQGVVFDFPRCYYYQQHQHYYYFLNGWENLWENLNLNEIQ